MGDGYKPYMKVAENGFVVCYYKEVKQKDYTDHEKHEMVYKYHEYKEAMMSLMKYANMDPKIMDNKPNGMNPSHDY